MKAKKENELEPRPWDAKIGLATARSLHPGTMASLQLCVLNLYVSLNRLEEQ